MNNGRPLPARKQLQFLVALTLLAWATQTLLAQWSRGAEVARRDDPAVDAAASSFVPRGGGAGEGRALAGSVLELRGEATVYGGDVKLKQVCRWSTRDAATFAPVADLVIARLDGRRPFRVLDVNEVRQTLADAGVNVALVRFSGPVECTVSRTDVELAEGEALEKWIQAHGGGDRATDGGNDGPLEDDEAHETRRAEETRVAPEAREPHEAREPYEPQPAALRQPPFRQMSRQASPREEDAAEAGVRTLRGLLVADLSVRLGLPADQLQVTFDPRDESALNLAEPTFKFNLSPRRVRDLGEVAWDVAIVTGTGSRKAQIRATARAWQQQLLVVKPLSHGQVIRASDVTARRALVDQMPDGALLAAEQVVGQIAARDLKAGTLVTAPLVEAVPLAKVGQFITITLNRGTVRVKSVGKALEGGSFGETIRVKNEATRDVYQVVLTGPQEAIMPAPDGPPGVASAPDVGLASLERN